MSVNVQVAPVNPWPSWPAVTLTAIPWLLVSCAWLAAYAAAPATHEEVWRSEDWAFFIALLIAWFVSAFGLVLSLLTLQRGKLKWTCVGFSSVMFFVPIGFVVWLQVVFRT